MTADSLLVPDPGAVRATLMPRRDPHPRPSRRDRCDNVAGIAQGWNDSELSERGQRRRCSSLAERLAAMQPTALYSSPLGRALSTAEAIADGDRARDHAARRPARDELRRMGRAFVPRRPPRRRGRSISAGSPMKKRPVRTGSRTLTCRAAPRARDSPASTASGRSSSRTAPRSASPRRPCSTCPMMAARHFAQDNAAMNVFVWRGDRWILKVWNDTTHCVEPNDPRTDPRATHRNPQEPHARAVRPSRRPRRAAGAAEAEHGRSGDADRARAGEGAQAQAARDRGAARERDAAADARRRR